MTETVIPEQAHLRTVTIAANASLSDALDTGLQRVAVLYMPAAWDTARLTLQGSTDGVSYADLYDFMGNEYTVAVAANHAVIIPFSDLIGVRFIKLRSGTGAAPVVQTAVRSIGVSIQ